MERTFKTKHVRVSTCHGRFNLSLHHPEWLPFLIAVPSMWHCHLLKPWYDRTFVVTVELVASQGETSGTSVVEMVIDDSMEFRGKLENRSSSLSA